MSKGTFYTGQPIFSQVLSYIPKHRVRAIARELQTDRYYKELHTYEHLVTLLYAIFNRCNGLREVVTGLQAWEQRIKHLGIDYQPRKSTLSDANRHRTAEVFERIYMELFAKYAGFLPDSRVQKRSRKLHIVDSTTITLCQEILKGVSRPPISGRRKGGIKVHMLIDSDQDVPCLVRMTAASASDNPFLAKINLAKGSILVMDRGYVIDYAQLNRFDKEGVSWISRLRGRTVYSVESSNAITSYQRRNGVLSDEQIIMGHQRKNNNKKVFARLIKFQDVETKQVLHFVTNAKKLTSTQIANYYKRRWQIESLFKRLKQTYPLSRFMGDNENAIKIQIWCALIADLLIKLIKSAAARSWSFSNLASTIRLHLMTYINLFAFLKNPEKALLNRQQIPAQLPLFPT